MLHLEEHYFRKRLYFRLKLASICHKIKCEIVNSRILLLIIKKKFETNRNPTNSILSR